MAPTTKPTGFLNRPFVSKSCFLTHPPCLLMQSLQRVMGCKSAVLTALCVSWGPLPKWASLQGNVKETQRRAAGFLVPLRALKEGSELAKEPLSISRSQGLAPPVVSWLQGHLPDSFLLQVHQSRPAAHVWSGAGLWLKMP